MGTGDISAPGTEFLIGGSVPGAGNLIAECGGGNASRVGITARDDYSRNPPVRIQGILFGTDVNGHSGSQSHGYPKPRRKCSIWRTCPYRRHGARRRKYFCRLDGSGVAVRGDRYYFGYDQSYYPPDIEIKGNRFGLAAEA
jgi:hypothetical protein